MTATIKITCNNAAFFDDDSEARDMVCTNIEISRILRKLADKLDTCMEDKEIRLRDSNGNHVGEFKITGK